MSEKEVIEKLEEFLKKKGTSLEKFIEEQKAHLEKMKKLDKKLVYARRVLKVYPKEEEK